VPGDLVELEAGDQVPAVARLVSATAYRAQEAALTGESAPVTKDAAAVLEEGTALAERANMVFMGTIAAAGRARAVVTATGTATEIGRIAGMLERAAPRTTPLQRRLAALGRVLVWVCLGLVLVIALLQLLRGGELSQVLLVAVSLAVAAVPEGLPAVVTIALALGLQRLVRRNALVRKLPSVETLGSVTVICSDKTGTLTRNEMTVREIGTGGRWYRVTGAGYAPHGRFLTAPPPAERRVGDQEDSAAELGAQVDPREEVDLRMALEIAVRCNNARLVSGDEEGVAWKVLGDPTEGALVVAAMKAGIEPELAAGRRVVFELPFEPERRRMSVAIRDGDASVTLYVKGAPEVLLELSTRERRNGKELPLDDARRREILEDGAALAADALRVLALAYRRGEHFDPEDAERDLVFAGLAGMQDPPREGAREAVATCRRAGIRPVMITGDHPSTALAIARELGIAGPDDGVVTGRDLDQLSEGALVQRVEGIAVYARVEAGHKLRVVRAWKSRGQVVAMTGDGVNDAPALQEADIGIAMGITGTEVTRQAADMVLVDDNFASIVAAVEEGRGIFDDIQKFVLYLLSTNSAEVLFMLAAAVAGWPVPLIPIQILWMNLVTDGLPALALGVEPPEPDVMERPPRPARQSLLGRAQGAFILGRGAMVMAAGAIGFALVLHGAGGELERARTVAFCTVVFAQLLYAFAFRSQRYTLPELGLTTNRPLLGAVTLAILLQLAIVLFPAAHSVFDVSLPTPSEWGLIAGLSITPVTIVEVAKILRSRARRR